jgi:hypothetical protein
MCLRTGRISTYYYHVIVDISLFYSIIEVPEHVLFTHNAKSVVDIQHLDVPTQLMQLAGTM